MGQYLTPPIPFPPLPQLFPPQTLTPTLPTSFFIPDLDIESTHPGVIVGWPNAVFTTAGQPNYAHGIFDNKYLKKIIK